MENTFEHTWMPLTTVTSGHGVEVEPDVWCLPVQIVNVFMVGNPTQSSDWVLIDAGMPHSADNNTPGHISLFRHISQQIGAQLANRSLCFNR